MPSVSTAQIFFLEFNSERLYKFKEGKKRHCVVFTTFPIQKIRHFQKVVLVVKAKKFFKSITDIKSYC